jgi:hypothetical protein
MYWLRSKMEISFGINMRPIKVVCDATNGNKVVRLIRNPSVFVATLQFGNDQNDC